MPKGLGGFVRKSFLFTFIQPTTNNQQQHDRHYHFRPAEAKSFDMDMVNNCATFLNRPEFKRYVPSISRMYCDTFKALPNFRSVSCFLLFLVLSLVSCRDRRAAIRNRFAALSQISFSSPSVPVFWLWLKQRLGMYLLRSNFPCSIPSIPLHSPPFPSILLHSPAFPTKANEHPNRSSCEREELGGDNPVRG